MSHAAVARMSRLDHMESDSEGMDAFLDAAFFGPALFDPCLEGMVYLNHTSDSAAATTWASCTPLPVVRAAHA